MGDKLGGLTEEMKGKVLKKPEVAQHGHDRRTGELKKQEEDAAVCIDLILSLFASQYISVFETLICCPLITELEPLRI